MSRKSAPTFESISEARYTRRQILGFAGKLGALAAISTALPSCARKVLETDTSLSSLRFTEIPKTYLETATIAPGYRMDVLLRWGEPLFPDAPAFDPYNQTAAAQKKQFGYNCDYTAFLPHPNAPDDNTRGLLFVNHEYTNARLMFPGNNYEDEEGAKLKSQVEIEKAAQGFSIVEIVQENGTWRKAAGHRYNRRAHASTPMQLSGPAAGDDRLKTSADPSGTAVLGTFGNCAGGITAWHSVLTCEENIDGYFRKGDFPDSEKANHARMGVGRKLYNNWGFFEERFDAAKEPHEPNRFGWVVEVDPYGPASTPVKRTALGRFKHESATTVLSHDGRVVIYMGDDEKFEYLYRFISERKYNPHNRQANFGLLDSGILSVATFSEDGTLKWNPLLHGQGPLTAANGFRNQADVLIETRRAGELLGATPMDRPEDIDVSPVTGKVYVSMTKNKDRAPDNVNVANPRAKNIHGHIIEMIPPSHGDLINHTADIYKWEMLLQGGDPLNSKDDALYLNVISEHGWLSCPDNLAFDPQGRLWIATDGQTESINASNGLYASDTEGPGRGSTRQFFLAPKGAEVSGPTFSADGKTLFLSVMHPSEDKGAHFDNPSTRWPDFQKTMPPRPSVIVITKADGGVIGS